MHTKIRYYSVITCMAACLILHGCSHEKHDKDVLFQYGTLGALMEGVYDGGLTCSQLKNHGDFGLGTFNTLDGEMIVINHQVIQIKADGSAYAAHDTTKIPFAVVTHFESEQTEPLNKSLSYSQLKTYIDSLLPTLNIPFAVKIRGIFHTMKTRSVPAQKKPYKRLLDVLKNQPEFEFQDVTGTIIGFRLPDYMDKANAPGYHFHFITENMDAGGHVLDFIVKNVKIEIDHTHEWHALLPDDKAFYDVKMSEDRYR